MIPGMRPVATPGVPLHRTLRRLRLAVLTLVLALAATEAVARIGWRYEDTVLAPANERLQDHATRFFVLRPGWSDPAAGFTVGPDGFRGPALRPHGPGTTRILLLGESSTMGAEVRDDEVYARRLEALLGDGYEVVNAGVGAWTVWQSRVFLEEEIDTLRPDVVIPYHQVNDALPTGVVDAHNFLYDVKLTDKALWARREPFAPALTLLYDSRAYLLLRKQVLLRQAEARVGVRAPPPGANPRVPDADRREAWDTMAELCDARGVILVPVLPTYREAQPPDRVIPAFAAAHGLPLVDLDAARRTSGIPPARFFADAVHPSAVGHQFIAEQLYAALAARGATGANAR